MLSNYEKKTLQYKVFATNELTVFYRDAVTEIILGFYFLEKEMHEPLNFCPLYCKIMHLKAKREFTILVSSNSDFVSANVILNQHP